MSSKDVSAWTSKEVASWAQTCTGIPGTFGNFVLANNVDGIVLLTLDHFCLTFLAQLSIHDSGHVLFHIQKLQEASKRNPILTDLISSGLKKKICGEMGALPAENFTSIKEDHPALWEAKKAMILQACQSENANISDKIVQNWMVMHQSNRKTAATEDKKHKTFVFSSSVDATFYVTLVGSIRTSVAHEVDLKAGRGHEVELPTSIGVLQSLKLRSKRKIGPLDLDVETHSQVLHFRNVKVSTNEQTFESTSCTQKGKRVRLEDDPTTLEASPSSSSSTAPSRPAAVSTPTSTPPRSLVSQSRSAAVSTPTSTSRTASTSASNPASTSASNPASTSASNPASNPATATLAPQQAASLAQLLYTIPNRYWTLTGELKTVQRRDKQLEADITALNAFGSDPSAVDMIARLTRLIPDPGNRD